MIPYYLVFTLLLFASAVEVFICQKRDKILESRLFYLSILLLIFFFGTRGYVGWDWQSYRPEFDRITLSNMSFEKGFGFYTLLLKKIYFNYPFYIFMNTLIDFLIIQWAFRKYSLYPVFSLLLFFGIQGLPMEVDLLRNMKTILLFIISLEFIYERKFIYFFILNLIGLSFHMSALLYFPMYFILNRTWKKHWILGAFLAGNIYYLLDLKILIRALNYFTTGKIGGYISLVPSHLSLGLTPFYLERILGFCLLVVLMDKIKDYRYKNIIANSYYISVFIFLFTSELSIFSVRVGILFVYASWFLWPMLLWGSKKELRALVFILATMVAGFRLYNHLSFPGNMLVYPYENILNGPGNYDSKLEVLKRAVQYRDEGHGRELLLLY